MNNYESEEWKDVVGYEQHFKVSNHGRIFSKRTNKVLVLGLSKSGYPVLSTRIGGRDGKCLCLKIHRLVADAFLPPPSDSLIDYSNNTVYKKVIVNHIDGIKTNNYVSNLEWSDYSKNIKHAIQTGLLPIKIGIEHHSTVIKDLDERKTIYEQYITSGLSMRKFCENNGITRPVLSRLLKDFQ